MGFKCRNLHERQIMKLMKLLLYTLLLLSAKQNTSMAMIEHSFLPCACSPILLNCILREVVICAGFMDKHLKQGKSADVIFSNDILDVSPNTWQNTCLTFLMILLGGIQFCECSFNTRGSTLSSGRTGLQWSDELSLFSGLPYSIPSNSWKVVFLRLICSPEPSCISKFGPNFEIWSKL